MNHYYDILGFLAFLGGLIGFFKGSIPYINVHGRGISLAISLAGLFILIGPSLANMPDLQATSSVFENETEDRLDVEATRALKEHIDYNFGGLNGMAPHLKTSWYDYIIDVEIRFSKNGERYAIVYTTLHNDDFGRQKAQRLYGAVMSFQTIDNPVRIKWIEVINPGTGEQVLSKKNPFY